MMSTRKPRYSERVAWMPTAHRLGHHLGRGSALFAHREGRDEHWWSDGFALFRGSPPAYLRDAYLDAGLPVDATLPERSAAAIIIARNAPAATELGDPVASYEANGRSQPSPVPVDVFAAVGTAAEIHIDACYVTHARRTFPLCTFWRSHDGAAVLVREHDGTLVGIIQRRLAPGEPRRRRGTP